MFKQKKQQKVTIFLFLLTNKIHRICYQNNNHKRKIFK